MDPIRKIPKKITKKFVNKVINRQYFHRKTGLKTQNLNLSLVHRWKKLVVVDLAKKWGKITYQKTCISIHRLRPLITADVRSQYLLERRTIHQLKQTQNKKDCKFVWAAPKTGVFFYSWQLRKRHHFWCNSNQFLELLILTGL